MPWVPSYLVCRVAPGCLRAGRRQRGGSQDPVPRSNILCAARRLAVHSMSLKRVNCYSCRKYQQSTWYRYTFKQKKEQRAYCRSISLPLNLVAGDFVFASAP